MSLFRQATEHASFRTKNDSDSNEIIIEENGRDVNAPKVTTESVVRMYEDILAHPIFSNSKNAMDTTTASIGQQLNSGT